MRPEFLTAWEADEDGPVWESCDRCKEPDPHLEPVGDDEQWCGPCVYTEAMRLREEDERDAEMRSLKGYYSSELDRI
jgi:hypothetical protein